jgi:hypothetical protein
LTAPHPITPTPPRCPSAWQPNPGRRSTYRRGKSVQTTGTTSFLSLQAPPLGNQIGCSAAFDWGGGNQCFRDDVGSPARMARQAPSGFNASIDASEYVLADADLGGAVDFDHDDGGRGPGAVPLASGLSVSIVNVCASPIGISPRICFA